MNNKYHEGLYNNQMRALRKKLELRQTDVADIMGFEVIDRICHWERGRAQPGLINVIRLCKLYNVTIDELYPQLCQQIQEEILESENRNYLRSLEKADSSGTPHTS